MAEPASSSSLWSNIITIIAVAFGWVLGELTGVFRRKRQIKVRKKALIQELKVCQGYSKRNLITLEYMISLTVLGKLGDFAPVELPTYIYDKHFSDISIHLSNSERISFHSIYSLIKMSEIQTNEMIKLRQDSINDNLKKKEYNQLIEGIYHNVYLTISLIEYHLKHEGNLDINKLTGEEEEKMRKASNEELPKIIAEANELGINGVQKKFNYL